MFGLHGIIAMLSTLTVNTTVSSPIRAAASAASHPAWPAPMTAISIVSSKTAIFPVLFYLNSTNCFVTIYLYRTC